MSDLIWTLWLIDVLSSLGGAAATILVIGFVGGVFAGTAVMCFEKPLPTKLIKPTGIVVSLLIAVLILVPSRDTLEKILVVGIADRVAQTELAQELGGDVGEIAKDSIVILKNYLKEMKGEAE